MQASGRRPDLRLPAVMRVASLRKMLEELRPRAPVLYGFASKFSIG